MEPGLIPRISQALLTRCETASNFSFDVSFVEIYNERVYDLLNPNEEDNLRVREHPETGPFVEGLSWQPAPTLEMVLKLIESGSKHRHVGDTSLNSGSHRGHAIFSIVLKQVRRFLCLLTSASWSCLGLADCLPSSTGRCIFLYCLPVLSSCVSTAWLSLGCP